MGIASVIPDPAITGIPQAEAARSQRPSVQAADQFAITPTGQRIDLSPHAQRRAQLALMLRSVEEAYHAAQTLSDRGQEAVQAHRLATSGESSCGDSSLCRCEICGSEHPPDHPHIKEAEARHRAGHQGATGQDNPDGVTAKDSSDGAQKPLTDDEKREVAQLRARDAEVRAHEAAHMGAAGALATGGASYDYEVGPDGKRYAVGGEVGIELREGKTPEETIRIARQVRAAALAPAQPSGQDLKVAEDAAAMMRSAEAERAKKMQSSEGGSCGCGKSPCGCGSAPGAVPTADPEAR